MTAPIEPEPTPTTKGLTRESWRYAARRTVHGVIRHRVIDSAAALTYFSALALFPGSLAIVSIVAIISGGKEQATARITDVLREFLKPHTVDSFQGAIAALLNIPNPGIALAIGLALSIWAVSSYATSFGRAINSVYEVEEGRQFWKFRPLMMVLAVGLILGFAVVGIILLGTPTVAAAVATNLGIPQIWIIAWDVLKWPVLAIAVFVLVGLVYYYTPNVRHLRLRWVSWGAAFALVAWGAATAGFGIYVTTVDSYNRVYGWLGGAVALLLWLYITNFVLLIGAEADAEIVRLRQLAVGIAAESDIRLPLRDTKRNLTLARRKTRDEADGRAIREKAEEARNHHYEI